MSETTKVLTAAEIQAVRDDYLSSPVEPNIEAICDSNEALRAEVERLTQELTRIIGSVQRLQPAGSPPPGGPEILVEWIIATQQAALAAMTAERDELMRGLFPSGVPTDYPWHQTIRMVLDGMGVSHQQHLQEAAERVKSAESASERLAQIEARVKATVEWLEQARAQSAGQVHAGRTLVDEIIDRLTKETP